MGLIETITTNIVSAYFGAYEENVVTRYKDKEICRSYKLPIRIVTEKIGGDLRESFYNYFIINDKVMVVIYSEDAFEIFLLTNNNVNVYQFAVDSHLTLNDITIQPSGIVTEDIIFKHDISPLCKINFGVLAFLGYETEPTCTFKFNVYETFAKSTVTISEEGAMRREIGINIPEGVGEYSTYFDVNIPFTMSAKNNFQDILLNYSYFVVINTGSTEELYNVTEVLEVYKYGEFGYIYGYGEEYTDVHHYIEFYITRKLNELPRETPVIGMLNNHYVVGNMLLKRRVRLEPLRTFEFHVYR